MPRSRSPLSGPCTGPPAEYEAPLGGMRKLASGPHGAGRRCTRTCVQVQRTCSCVQRPLLFVACLCARLCTGAKIRGDIEALVDYDACAGNLHRCSPFATCIVASFRASDDRGYVCECNKGWVGDGFECENVDGKRACSNKLEQAVCALRRSHKRKDTARTHARTHAHAHFTSRTHARIRARAHTHTHTHTHKHALRTHTPTHIYAHTQSASRSRRWC